MDGYSEHRNEFEAVVALAADLGVANSGHAVTDGRLEDASHIFVNITLHAMSVLRLAPTGVRPTESGATEIWDLGSISAVVRCLVDAYFVLFYIAVDQMSDEERESRKLLWKYHAQRTTLTLLKEINTTAQDLPQLEDEVKRRKAELLRNCVYEKLAPKLQEKARDGKLAAHVTNSELAKRGGMSPSFYKTVFRDLSDQVHTYPRSVQELKAFEGGPETLKRIDIVLRYCTAFLSFAIRDYRKLFPHISIPGTADADKIVNDWLTEAAEAWDED